MIKIIRILYVIFLVIPSILIEASFYLTVVLEVLIVDGYIPKWAEVYRRKYSIDESTDVIIVPPDSIATSFISKWKAVPRPVIVTGKLFLNHNMSLVLRKHDMDDVRFDDPNNIKRDKVKLSINNN